MTNPQPTQGGVTPPSLLLIVLESAAPPIVEALRRDLRAEVETTCSRRSALTSLRRNDFALILIDDSLATADAASIDLIYQNAGSALVIELNLSLSSAARIVRQARSALSRRSRELAQARTTASAALLSEINSTLTGVLLESQLALREASPIQAPRLRHLVQLASDLRDHLRA